jgi:uncharacterized protein (DUF2147 family)
VKRIVLAAVLTFAAAAAATAQPESDAASSAVGLWATDNGRAEIQIVDCDGALCGDLVSAVTIRADPDLEDKRNSNPALQRRKLKGLRILRGFTGGPTEWRGGSVYNPDDGGTYRGVITLVDSQTLKLTGCIIWPICKTTRLIRTPTTQAAEAL